MPSIVFLVFLNMNSLFPKEKITFNLPDAEIEYLSGYFDYSKANELFQRLLHETPWQQDYITVFNKTHPQPRLTAFYNDSSKPYTYSSVVMNPNKWTPLLIYIKQEVEAISREHFNSVLLNLYRDGKDSNGWHADNERELGNNPTIASVSFGSERSFNLQHNTINDAKLKITLEHGSVLLMKGSTQHFWKHQLAKTSKVIGPRINLTFRNIL